VTLARIEDYAIVGDLHTAGLIGTDGSMDWLCLPHFNSAACFAAARLTAGRSVAAGPGIRGILYHPPIPYGHLDPGDGVGVG
jgi:GH15 family glucan-1,4-alpha-glucosidase